MLLNKSTNLIFVWIGNTIPNWVIISLKIAVENSYCKVLLLTTKIDNRIDVNCSQYVIQDFYQPIDFNKNPLNDYKFRDGFWIKTTERLHVINAFVKKYKINYFFHAELDNLIFNISSLPSKLDQIGKGIFIPKDSKDRCIASLIYINDFSILDSLCKYIIQNPNKLSNDMYLLGDFTKNNPKNSFYLPNESVFNSTNDVLYLSFDKCEGIFDAAAIGQFLFGIDPRNSKFPIFNKFINENTKYDLEKCTFYLSISSNVALINNLNLYNIHVHSKIFEKLIDENWLNRLIKRLNNKKKTLITYNFLCNL